MNSTLQLQTYTSTKTITTTTTTTKSVTDTINSMVSITKMVAEMKPYLADELVKKIPLRCPFPYKEMKKVVTYHNREIGPNQCCSVVIQHINAPIDIVWSLVRRFDEPQTYKRLLRSCRVITGNNGEVGCLREVQVVSGIPASKSTEILEVFDEESHATGFRVVSGEHRLQNYKSVTTLHPSLSCSTHYSDEQDNTTTASGTDASPTCYCEGTVVVESYVVDVPNGNTKEETCVFVDTIIRFNLQSLAKICEQMARSSCKVS